MKKMKNNSTAFLRTLTLDGTLYYAPFVNKNCWVKKEGEMKVTKETPVYSFNGEDMVKTTFEKVSAQK